MDNYRIINVQLTVINIQRYKTFTQNTNAVNPLKKRGYAVLVDNFKSSIIMRGSIRNQFEMRCPKCRATVIIKEVNDGSPMRVYDCALCPECGEILYEKAIVGAFETEFGYL